MMWWRIVAAIASVVAFANGFPVVAACIAMLLLALQLRDVLH